MNETQSLNAMETLREQERLEVLQRFTSAADQFAKDASPEQVEALFKGAEALESVQEHAEGEGLQTGVDGQETSQYPLPPLPQREAQRVNFQVEFDAQTRKCRVLASAQPILDNLSAEEANLIQYAMSVSQEVVLAANGLVDTTERIPRPLGGTIPNAGRPPLTSHLDEAG